MKFCWFVLFVCNVIAVGQAQRRPPTSEQTVFSAEDERVEKPVPIPVDVMALLMRDDFVKNQLQNEGIVPGDLPQSWFSASVIHLSASPRHDYIVIAEPPLAGANTVMFWVFLATGYGQRLGVRSGGHSLSILKMAHNGYRDLEFRSVTLQREDTAIYRFNGERYVFVSRQLRG